MLILIHDVARPVSLYYLDHRVFVFNKCSQRSHPGDVLKRSLALWVGDSKTR